MTKKLLTLILVVTICLTGFAQKLPGLQTVSVNAPTDIKIDGKPSEWGNKFQAYNNATEFFYTIANDTNNLYIVVQSTDNGIIQKIVAGGITFTFKSTDKKSTVIPVVITYPLVPSPYDSGVSYKLRTNPHLSDAELNTLNNQVSGHIKEIEITGAKGIADSAVSVYNDMGIKAAGLIDQQKAYTCELAIPLKYINQLFNSTGTFKYRMQVNGLSNSGRNGIIVVGGSNTAGPSEIAIDHNSSLFLLSPTYLNGTYTLAK